MINLVAKSAAESMLPLSVGALSLSEIPEREMHSIAPFKVGGVSDALQEAVGVGLPEIGCSVAKGSVQVLWVARGQYFLIGALPPKLSAAISGQSDAWCAVSLSGKGAQDVMARLCPLEVCAMGEGDVARSLIGHMSAIIVKREAGFEIMVFRAFAKTLVHEVHAVMMSVQAQADLPD